MRLQRGLEPAGHRDDPRLPPLGQRHVVPEDRPHRRKALDLAPLARRGPGAGRAPLLLRRFPFAIGYVVEDDTVTVLAIAHLRRRPGYWLRRAGGET